MAETVVVLEPGEERAQKIAKAMSSQTAGDILRLIGDGQKTSTEISDQLALPMNTAKYHIENLLDAGLISVASTKYSVKGREVKVYTVTNQLLIVAPKQLNVRSLLMKYASLFGIVALGSVVIAALSPIFGSAGTAGAAMNAAPRAGSYEAAGTLAKAVSDGAAHNVSGASDMVAWGPKGASQLAAANITPVPAPAACTPVIPPVPETVSSAVTVTPETALAFFLGGTCVIVLLLCYEMYLWRRQKKR